MELHRPPGGLQEDGGSQQPVGDHGCQQRIPGGFNVWGGPHPAINQHLWQSQRFHY